MQIEDVYYALKRLGFVRTQMEFSRVWLGRSPRYYSSLLAKQHQPGPGTLSGLLFRLHNLQSHSTDVRDKAAIFLLSQQLEKHITLRVIACKVGYNCGSQALVSAVDDLISIALSGPSPRPIEDGRKIASVTSDESILLRRI